MTYKLVRKLNDLELAIQDYKWRLITEGELRQKIIDTYRALEEELGPEFLKDLPNPTRKNEVSK